VRFICRVNGLKITQIGGTLISTRSEEIAADFEGLISITTQL